jgi:hypothetical protein
MSRDNLNPSKDAKDKVTITLAIDRDIMDNVRRNSSRDGLSINAMINNILKKWDRFYQYLPEHQVILVTARNFEKILELLDEQFFIDTWRYDENLVNGIFGQRGIALTLDNLIDYEYQIFGTLGGAFKSVSAYKDSEGYTNIVFTHRYGLKWSRIVAAVFTEQLSTYFKCHTSSEIIPSKTTIKILDKNIGITRDH